MKKQTIKILLLLVPCTSVFSQQTLSVNNVIGDHAVYESVKSDGMGKSLKYEEIAGSPFVDKTFYLAKIAEGYEKVPVRYNNFRDEIEFTKDNTVLVLPKEKKFSRIEIPSSKQTLVLLDEGGDLKGYFFELVNGKNLLYKKVKVKFVDMIPAANSYASDKPASFKLQNPTYYIKTEKGFIEKPANQKNIIEYFPKKKDELNAFFKENKIKFNKEEDLIKLVNFINQN